MNTALTPLLPNLQGLAFETTRRETDWTPLLVTLAPLAPALRTLVFPFSKLLCRRLTASFGRASAAGRLPHIEQLVFADPSEFFGSGGDTFGGGTTRETLDACVGHWLGGSSCTDKPPQAAATTGDGSTAAATVATGGTAAAAAAQNSSSSSTGGTAAAGTPLRGLCFLFKARSRHWPVFIREGVLGAFQRGVVARGGDPDAVIKVHRQEWCKE